MTPPRSGLRFAFVLALLVLSVAGCERTTPLEPDEPTDPLFERYVALGNSITAGFQSGGIHEDSQRAAYPVLLAERMHTPFSLPLLNRPGCPPPLIDILTGEREGGEAEAFCAFRATPLPPRVQNLAVPGARVIDPLDNLDSDASPNPLTQLILGGRTQVEAAELLAPTFVSLWIGNNDLLGAALSGVVHEGRLTPVEEFADRYERTLDRLVGAGARGGVLMAVADVTIIPFLSRGSAYWVAQSEGLLPASLTVEANCAPAERGGVGDEHLVPFDHGFGELVRRASQGESAVLDCLDDPRVLTVTEIRMLADREAAYNQVIRAEAEARGWAFVDLNPLLRSLRTEGEIPSFPDLENPGAIFGSYFSLDGVHPSDAAHRRIGGAIVEGINQEYGTGLEPILP